jgi:hypothetical protein
MMMPPDLPQPCIRFLGGVSDLDLLPCLSFDMIDPVLD